MPHNIDNEDLVRIRHMLAAAKEALAFSRGRNRENLDNEPMFRRAILNCVQEIGEAAVKVTEPTRHLAPAIPWRQIVGMRHRLVHVYFSVNHDLLWEVVAKDLPTLIPELDTLVLQSK